MIKTIIIILLSLMVLNSGVIQSKNIESSFSEANRLYSNKKYSEAVQHYEQIIKSGYISSELYFNLGNTYYRLGKTAEPIFYFEKAIKISPDDEDIQHNLKIANLRTIDKYDEVPPFFITAVFLKIRDSRTVDSWGVVAVVLAWITAIILALFLILRGVLLKKIMFASGLVSLLLCISSLTLCYLKSDYEKSNKEAIVFSSSAYVKSSPDKDGNDLFILHEGAKIKILEQVKQNEIWNKIQLPNGRTGWMLNSDSKVI